MATKLISKENESRKKRTWRLGVGGRLLLAFFGIAAFGVLAAVVGVYAFREVGGRLDIIETTVPHTLSAIELSRSAERIIAAAPALLAANDRSESDQVKAELAAEVERLNAKLAELSADGEELLHLRQIKENVVSLTVNLGALEELVASRLLTNERIRVLRADLLQTSSEIRRLLAPWLQVVGSQISNLVEARKIVQAGPNDPPYRLASLIELQQRMRTAQEQIAVVADRLTEASTTEQVQRLTILAFQLSLAFRDLDTTMAGLDPSLFTLLQEQTKKLQDYAAGPDAIVAVRKQELVLVDEGEKLLKEIGSLSLQLTTAVDQLGSAAKREISGAIRDVSTVQHLSTHALVAVVALSLLTSILIVWRYVGGNIVRRLTELSQSMLTIAGGRLDAPVEVEGSDEIGEMGRALEIFRRNTLERDSFERANKYKTRFLASASHDLRQPLHALTLFAAQLSKEVDPTEQDRLVAQINIAVSSINNLFQSLLDMTKLDAGLLVPKVSEFPIGPLLSYMETTFAGSALERGLRLRVVPSSAWVRSDSILLERILLNLLSNATRFTTHGGIVVGCRRRANQLRIDVCDSGTGISPDQQQRIFGEFVQLAAPQPEHRDGLGLGLSIVDRLSRLLHHPIEVNSLVGRGSRFSITVPLAAARTGAIEASVPFATITDPVRGKLIVVIDDDAMVLDGMDGILRSWGSAVITAESPQRAMAKLATQRLKPDLIISDYRLATGKRGIEAIKGIRDELGAVIPAFLISGDTAPEVLGDARRHGFHLLHKPVSPMRLRSMLNQLLRPSDQQNSSS